MQSNIQQYYPNFYTFYESHFFPGQTPVPPRSGTCIPDLSHDPIRAIWLAEVRKFHQHHYRMYCLHCPTLNKVLLLLLLLLPLHPNPPSKFKPNSTARFNRFSSGTPCVTLWNSLCSIPVTWVSTHNHWSALILESETVYPRKTLKKFAKKKDLVIMIKPGTYVE